MINHKTTCLCLLVWYLFYHLGESIFRHELVARTAHPGLIRTLQTKFHCWLQLLNLLRQIELVSMLSKASRSFSFNQRRMVLHRVSSHYLSLRLRKWVLVSLFLPSLQMSLSNLLDRVLLAILNALAFTIFLSWLEKQLVQLGFGHLRSHFVLRVNTWLKLVNRGRHCCFIPTVAWLLLVTHV